MKLSLKLLALVSWGMMAHAASALISIETVPVGYTGNANDPVNYDYHMGKYEVTLDQYTAFLNAVAATDTSGLYNSNMATDPHVAGIAQSGVSGSYTYSVIGSGNRPVTYVGWFDSLRFVNWLQNGQPVGAQAAGTTETGTYNLTVNIFPVLHRDASASGISYILPQANEWIKAGQSTGQGGVPNNAIPNSPSGSASDANSANVYIDDGIDNGFNGGYAVNNSTTIPTGNALTDVGTFSLAGSLYGTFDQAGNVWEWNEDMQFLGVRNPPAMGVAGGGWGGGFGGAVTGGGVDSARLNYPNLEWPDVGFRVAIVPEPSAVGVMAFGMAMLARSAIARGGRQPGAL